MKVKEKEPETEIRTDEEIHTKIIVLDAKIEERRTYDLKNPAIQSEIRDWRTQIKALKWVLKEKYDGKIYYEQWF